MRVRITWRGDTEAFHPDLGTLRPGEGQVVDVAPALVAALLGDGTGAYEVEVLDATAAPPTATDDEEEG